MNDLDIYNTYHNLWRIEESFKIMKSDLDARPVFLQTEESIKGHFLICYLTVLLERIFQFKVLEDKYSSSEIFGFIKGFKATKAERKYINTTTYSDFIDDLLLLLTYFVQQKTALVVQETELLMSLFGREAVGSPRLLSAIIFRVVLPV